MPRKLSAEGGARLREFKPGAGYFAHVVETGREARVFESYEQQGVMLSMTAIAKLLPAFLQCCLHGRRLFKRRSSGICTRNQPTNQKGPANLLAQIA